MGIHILDQSMESPYKSLSSRHEFLATSSNHEDTSNVIERIRRINLDATHLNEWINMDHLRKPPPPQNGSPKHLSVHPDEIKNMGTKSSTKQDGGDVHNYNSIYIRWYGCFI